MPEGYLDPLAARLSELQEQGSLTWSSLGSRARQSLQPLLDTGVLRLTRAGRGQRLELVEPAQLSRFIEHHYPGGLRADELTSRAAAVRRLRSAKRGGTASRYGSVLLRVLSPQGLSCDGLEDDALYRTSAVMGAVALVLGAQRECGAYGVAVTVENEDVFYRAEELFPAADLAVYTAGRMSARLLDWLARQDLQRLIHAGDYDPVGVAEYLRLRAALGERVALHLPDDLEALFQRYSEPAILRRTGNQRALAAIGASEDAAARQVLALIRRYGAGLEQEVLLGP